MDEQATRRLVEAVTREVLARLGTPVLGTPVSGGSAPSGSAPSGSGSEDPGDASGRRLLVAGNWKMNACQPDLSGYLAELPSEVPVDVDALLLPPSVLLAPLRQALDTAGLSRVETGGQDVHVEAKGAHTGETSAALLRQVGAAWSLVGHSERRAAGETDDVVARKVRAGLAGGLRIMLCVGERLPERRSRATFRVLRQQLLLACSPLALTPPSPGDLAVAYEPVWAIGTGERATLEQVAEATGFLRSVLASIFDYPRAARIRILYGGSVTPESAGEILSLADVDGVLVGGASLTGRSFAGILRAGVGVVAERRALALALASGGARSTP